MGDDVESATIIDDSSLSMDTQFLTFFVVTTSLKPDSHIQVVQHGKST